MRVAFSLTILFLAAFYSYLAFFGDLAFLSPTGRMAPGFFPRIIGVSLIVVTLYDLYILQQRTQREESPSPFWSVTLVVALLSGLFVAALNVLGGLVSMIVFLLASLFYLNRQHAVQNVILAAVLPISVYVLFRVWLNAAVPQGYIPLPH
jgi:hypothetical protein